MMVILLMFTRKQMHVTRGYRNETKVFKLSISRQTRWYIVLIDLSLPSLSNGPIKLAYFFFVACVILQFRKKIVRTQNGRN